MLTDFNVNRPDSGHPKMPACALLSNAMQQILAALFLAGACIGATTVAPPQGATLPIGNLSDPWGAKPTNATIQSLDKVIVAQTKWPQNDPGGKSAAASTPSQAEGSGSEGDPVGAAKSNEDSIRDRLRQRLARRDEGDKPTVQPKLGSWLSDLDAEVRRLATTLLLSGIIEAPPETEIQPALFDHLRTATTRDLREIAESVFPGIDPRHFPALRALLDRSDRASAWVFCDLVAKGPPALAEEEILDAIRKLPPSDRNVPHLIDGLTRVGSERSGTYLGEAMALGSRSARVAAAAATNAIHHRLLGLGDLDGANSLLSAARAQVPRDWTMLFQHARVVGIYQGQPDVGLQELSTEAARRDLLRGSSEATPWIELSVGVAIIRYFAGDPTGAAKALDKAHARVSEPAAHARAAALIWSKLHLVSALLAIDAGDAATAQAHFADAITNAPYDSIDCRFDGAWTGTFSVRTCLDRLRRTGRSDLALRYLSALDTALQSADDGRIGISETPPDHAPGSDDALYEGSLVRSWIPWYRATMLVNAGKLDEAVSCCDRVISQLEVSDVFTNRNMAAQIGVVLGNALMLRGDFPEAARAFERAASKLDELGKAWLDSDMRGRVAFLPAGSPPVPTPLSTLAADAWVSAAEARARKGDPTGANEALNVAARHTPISPRATLNIARRFAKTDPARVARILNAIPLSSTTALDRARLLAAVGQTEAATNAFNLHLAWNATTDLRRKAERELHATDPWWPPRSD